MTMIDAIKSIKGVNSVKLEGTKIIADVDEPKTRSPEFVKALVEAGADVISVNEQIHSLEEVYLQYIGGRA